MYGLPPPQVRIRPPLLALITTACLLAATHALGQPATAPAEDRAETRVFLVTMGPGELIYEKYGHNAIWVLDRGQNTSIAYNYGVFDWNEPGFLLRFIRGRMWYWLEPMPADQMLGIYVKVLKRAVWIQELNLTSAQSVALRDFLQWNARPENQRYRYDYYLDNCSTRVRDALDKALKGQLKQQLQAKPTGHTFRWHTRRIISYSPVLYTALEFVLGPRVDQPISAWDEGFLPQELQKHIQDVTVLDDQGRQVPLVKSEQRVEDLAGVPLNPVQPVRNTPPTWWPAYLLAGLAVAATLGGLARPRNRKRAARWAFSLLLYFWLILLGGAGTFLAGAWLLTDHSAIYHNENLLHFSPLALLVLIGLILRKRPWAARTALLAAATAAGIALFGLVLKLLPAFSQSNCQMIALTLPANLAMVWVVYALTGRKVEEPVVQKTAKGNRK